jgi:hypothetical protein
MALFDHTAARLARGSTVLFPADPADAIAEAILRYDPAVTVKSDRFVFRTGVRLHGPAEITTEVATVAGLAAGMTAGYRADIAGGGTSRSRPDNLTWQDAERLIRGLAARLGGTVHDERPPMDLHLSASVYSARALPAGQVIEVPQPYVATGELVPEPEADVPGAYYLLTERSPLFLVVYWPRRLSLPPPAVKDLAGEQRRWDLQTKYPVATAARGVCLTVAAAALALGNRTGGGVIDTYGFPVDRPEDLLPP